LSGKLSPTGWVRVIDIGGRSPNRDVGTGHGRGTIAVAADGVWVAHGWSRTLARLDPGTLELASLLELGRAPVAIAADPDAVWTLCANGWLWRARSSDAEGVARLGRGARAVAVARQGVWVLRENGELIRLDPSVGEVTLRARVGRGARNMVAADDALWVTSQRGRTLSRVDPESGAVEEQVRLPHRAIRLAADSQRVWAVCGRRSAPRKGWLYAVDVATGMLDQPAAMSGEPRAVAIGMGSVWVACAPRRHPEGVIERLDPASRAVEDRIETEWPVSALAVADSSLLAVMCLRLVGPVDVGHGFFGADGGGGHGGHGGHGGGGHHG